MFMLGCVFAYNKTGVGNIFPCVRHTQGVLLWVDNDAALLSLCRSVALVGHSHAAQRHNQSSLPRLRGIIGLLCLVELGDKASRASGNNQLGVLQPNFHYRICCMVAR